VGQVFDAEGRPYPEAKVICYSAMGGYRVGFSGKEGGAFRPGPLPRGRHKLEVQARGHPSLAIGEQEVAAGEERDLGVQFLGPALRE
jgi:hypothetical protein